ncbi:MAG: DUF1802 family protein [Planctomycetia bacterium]|nr:DUF1802 family protein [Planctomycetia bacterium]
MHTAIPTAFKEWAAICRALAQGRQRVILRKGGIVEPGGRFELACREFLLLPTFLHQSADSLVPEARDLLVGIDADRPPHGSVVLRHRARVTDALRIESLAGLARFRAEHVWADHVVEERFHRWRDELHVLTVEVTALAEPLVVPWKESYGGCRSWVDL